ncbi:MAG: glycolate oxidase subunit GlcF [Alphaproteobacteria bacterium]|nr:glycolate oxidase subunit GlcF [Alphaproteobacteria bacterium]
MQTGFTLAQLADPDIRESNAVLRACVHCGFCTATCPTYVLLGDELDSPRGRIYLIKSMLEQDGPPPADAVTHVDRCLSCLSCMTTCPSGVHYMHLVDHARHHIETRFQRTVTERGLRWLLARLLTNPIWFRLALLAANLARPLAPVLPARLAAMLKLAPPTLPAPSPLERPRTHPAIGPRRKRVALLAACAETVLAPEIAEATVRLLTRHGCEVTIAADAGCCGALAHHMGQTERAKRQARAAIDAWSALGEIDAVVVTASGCGTPIKDYGFLLREDPAYADKARRISSLARDISEILAELKIQARAPEPLRIAYHAACSLQHGQKLVDAPKALLRGVGFEVADVPEGHLCCGSAGTYNVMQPEIADRLRARKLGHIAGLGAEAVALGNVGCLMQLRSGTKTPVLHLVELLDWASGGPRPAALDPH